MEERTPFLESQAVCSHSSNLVIRVNNDSTFSRTAVSNKDVISKSYVFNELIVYKVLHCH